MTSTTNAHHALQRRLDAKPNYSITTNPKNKGTYWESLDTFTDRNKARPWCDRTLIYDPTRIVEPTNKFGLKFIDFVPPTTRYTPAGMLGQLLPVPIRGSHPTTMPFVKQFNTNL
jgi:hypothetical protein